MATLPSGKKSNAVTDSFAFALINAFYKIKDGAKRYDVVTKDHDNKQVTVIAYRVHDIIRIDIKEPKQ